MFGNFSYLFYMALFCWVPLLILSLKYHRYLKKYYAVFIKLLLICLPLGIAWDNFGIYFRAWTFVAEKELGIHIFLMPIESLLFTITVAIIICLVTIVLYEKDRWSS